MTDGKVALRKQAMTALRRSQNELVLQQKASLMRDRLRNRTLELASLCYLGASQLAGRHKWFKPSIIYVGDSGWVLSTIGRSIRRHLDEHYNFGPSFSWRGIRRSLVHFGSPPSYFGERIYLRIHPSNKQVVNWTHGQRSNPDPTFAKRLDNVRGASDYVDKIIVQSLIGLETLLQEGVDQNKLVHIPLGVDTQLFHPPTPDERARIREELDIPQSAYCIGSFQKDGNGWAKGLSPKLVKGPDTFLQVIKKLQRHYELYVLLTGPARGYVKSGLERMGVPYRHVYLKEYREVARHYWALDLYLIASRDEGGPMALLESMASGVPLVSTRVGMCIDLVRDGANGFLAEVEDVESLADSVAGLRDNGELHQMVSENAYLTAQCYDWSIIANRYHEEIYQPLTVIN